MRERWRRETKRDDLILTVFALAALVFMAVTIGSGLAILLANPPCTWQASCFRQN